MPQQKDSAVVPVITIDGASGTGKGTVSQLVAKQLGWKFLDSGALYRVLALAAQNTVWRLIMKKPSSTG